MSRFLVFVFLVILNSCDKSLGGEGGSGSGSEKTHKVCHYQEVGKPFRLTQCQVCTCDHYKHLHCETIYCKPFHCRKYTLPYGECCPVCIECYFGGVTLQHGSTYKPHPCLHCKCNYGYVHCDVVNCNTYGKGKGVPSTCRHPRFQTNQCCPTCQNGKDEICQHKNGFCVKGKTATKFGYPIGKCEYKGVCYPLPRLPKRDHNQNDSKKETTLPL